MEHIKKTLILVVLINSVLFIYPVYPASEPVEEKADVRLQQVALFKNGLGFFVSEVAIPKKQDSFSIVPFGAASHGTFWVSYPPKVKLESFIAKEIDSQELVEAVTIAELLKANVGRKVLLYLSGGEEPIIKGVIKYFAEDKAIDPPNPYAPGRVNRSRAGYVQSNLMMVETDDAEVAINPQNVMRVKFLEGNAEKTFNNKTKSTQFEVKMGAPASGKKLTLSYLAKGITWAPSYMVDITEVDKAGISAKAAVINEVCDMDDVTIQLVTGFPHLQFADIVSPLALKENLAQFLQSLARGKSEHGGLGGVMSNVMRQRPSRAYEEMEAPFIMPAYGSAEAGKVAEDLFFYPVENVNLKKGQIGYMPLFTESVPYKHIYQWKIPDYVSEDDRYSYNRRSEQEREPDEEVWHCLRMENDTKIPWTTAPAEIVKEGLILGQDTLNYTPVKSKTTLRITQAVSVNAEQLELETDRKRDAAQLYGYHYDLVTVEGKLSVTNFQDKTITLEISKILSGEVKSSQPEAKIDGLAHGLRRMNGVKQLTWTIELKAGDKKQLSYIYEVYVRR